MNNDYYSLLNLHPKATADDIKKSWRKLVLITHPDKGGNKELFQKISHAYSILSDKEARALYDATGRTRDTAAADRRADFLRRYATARQAAPHVVLEKGPNLLHKINVTLADLWRGKQEVLTLTRNGPCTDCSGAKVMAHLKCIFCSGYGACSHCNGTRRMKCVSCVGTGNTRKGERLVVTIKPGTTVNTMFHFEGKCSHSEKYKKPGDVICVVTMSVPDTVWSRNGNTLTRALLVTPQEATEGWVRSLKGHPSGETLHICWNAGLIHPRECLKLPGYGMPVLDGSGAYGDLILNCTVITPAIIPTEEQKADIASGIEMDPDRHTILFPVRYFAKT
jgi:DnaJ family protein A protein 2